MNIAEAEGLSPEKLAELLAEEVKARRAPLVEGLAASGNKTVARAAKKALYQLRSSGVAVAEPHRPAAVAAPIAPAESKELPSLMSSILGTGERALFFVRPLRGGGLEMFQVITHDELGIQQLDRGETNRQAYRHHLRQVRADTSTVIEVPLKRVLEELGVAWGANIRAKTALTPEAESQLRRLDVTPSDGWPPLPAVEAGDAALVARAASLHDQPELHPWLPTGKDIGVLSQRLDEVDASVLALSEMQKRDQRASKVLLSASELSAETRRVYAYRLWRMAEVLEQTQRPEPARIARAEARLLFHDPKAPSRFLESMFEKVVRLAEQSKAAHAAQSGGAPAMPPPPELRSPGGVIIP